MSQLLLAFVVTCTIVGAELIIFKHTLSFLRDNTQPAEHGALKHLSSTLKRTVGGRLQRQDNGYPEKPDTAPPGRQYCVVVVFFRNRLEQYGLQVRLPGLQGCTIPRNLVCMLTGQKGLQQRLLGIPRPFGRKSSCMPSAPKLFSSRRCVRPHQAHGNEQVCWILVRFSLTNPCAPSGLAVVGGGHSRSPPCHTSGGSQSTRPCYKCQGSTTAKGC